MGFNLGSAVKHFSTQRKGMVVANSDDSQFVVVEFKEGSELVHSGELLPSDHLINPDPAVVSERINLLIDDSTTRAIASKEFGLEANESLMDIEFLPLSHEMEMTITSGTKVSLKKVSVKVAKQALNNIENQVS
jgi:hypothetical protein